MSSISLLYSTAQVRAMDARAIANGTPGYALMKRAGEAALRALRSRWPTAMHVSVVTGGGNNGGDGFVLARFAQAAGLSASVLTVAPPEKLQGDARSAYEDLRASGVQPRAFTAGALSQADVIVDALLGTGLTHTVRAPFSDAIAAINAAQCPVFALDVPSGLNADSGEPMGVAVRADCTITFVAMKTGLFLADGPDYTGRLLFDDLELSPPPDPAFRPVLERMTEADISAALAPRPRQSNKGDFGRVLIVGGGPGMPGAVRLAGESCLRVGAGLVTVVTARENVAAIAAGRPELMLHPVERAEDLTSALDSSTVVAIGPGLGRTEWAWMILSQVLASGKPLVIDADALNVMAERDLIAPRGAILTPHPGEAARLLKDSTVNVQADRPAALRRLCRRYPGAVVVLKGAGTLIGTGDSSSTLALCERGNPAMAGAGMGDVLTGAIAGILGQCRDPWLAARAGVMAHALAGDDLARDRQRGVLALDLAEAISRWVNLRR
jgi:NAD(P)H-hydrate epimerase